MKKVSILLISLLAVFILASCGNKRTAENISAGTTAGRNDSVSGDGSQTAAENQGQDSSGKVSQAVSPQSGSSKVLIAYFSVPEDVEPSGTDAVAGASVVVSDGEKLGNTEYVAQLIQKTVGGELFRIETAESYPVDHDPLVDQAAAEQDENARPELSSHVEDFDQYETILLGYPNWWGDMPMPVYSFLEEYDFGAKTVIPFITHGGSGASRTIETITGLQPGALIRDNALVLSRNEVASSEEEVTAWAEGLGLSSASALPEMDGSNVAATAVPTPGERQVIYLWNEGNMPAVTEYTENNGGYADEPGFQPSMTTYPVPEGVPVKGAVLLCSGGAFQFRSDQYEGGPVAQDLSELGYQCFVVDYRVQPYTQEEGALDLARAVRFVRTHASEYGIEENDIAVMGFSAGGILAGEMLLNYDGTINGTALAPGYVPDELDQVSADAAADGMIYSFYGRLSIASTDVEKFAASNLPPTYFCYGTRDPFVGEFEKCVKALEEAGVAVESHALQDMPHGFGNQGGWITDYDRWLTEIFENNQEV